MPVAALNLNGCHGEHSPAERDEVEPPFVSVSAEQKLSRLRAIMVRICCFASFDMPGRPQSSELVQCVKPPVAPVSLYSSSIIGDINFAGLACFLPETDILKIGANTASRHLAPPTRGVAFLAAIRRCTTTVTASCQDRLSRRERMRTARRFQCQVAGATRGVPQGRLISGSIIGNDVLITPRSQPAYASQVPRLRRLLRRLRWESKIRPLTKACPRSGRHRIAPHVVRGRSANRRPSPRRGRHKEALDPSQ